MGLFNLFTKKKSEGRAQTNCAGEKIDRLTPDGDIPNGWVAANCDFISKAQREYSYFLNNWCDSKDKSPKEQYAALKSFVVYMNDLKRIWDSKGDCFSLYRSQALFSDDELAKYEQRLQYIKDNFENLEDEYQREQYIKQCVLPQIPFIIKENPGILQTEIYKMFAVDCKDSISYELYRLSIEEKIIREKSGRTYSLRIKE